jgi:hypothetical protein
VTEAAKVQSEQADAPTYDAFTHLLHRLEPDAATLRGEARGQVGLDQGILVIDDSTLDKPYARKMELVVRHWSGKHHAVVSGINLMTLLWTEGNRHVPVYIPHLRQEKGLADEERPLSGDAEGGSREGLSTEVRGLR